MQRVGRVGLDVDVVAEGTVGAIEEFDDAKALVDRVEQGPVALFAVGQRSFGALQLAIVGDRKGLEALAKSGQSFFAMELCRAFRGPSRWIFFLRNPISQATRR